MCSRFSITSPSSWCSSLEDGGFAATGPRVAPTDSPECSQNLPRARRSHLDEDSRQIATIEVRLLHGLQHNSILRWLLRISPNLGRPSRPCPGGTKWQNQHSNSLLEKQRALLNASSVSVCTLVTCRLACSLLWFECSCTHMVHEKMSKIVCIGPPVFHWSGEKSQAFTVVVYAHELQIPCDC